MNSARKGVGCKTHRENQQHFYVSEKESQKKRKKNTVLKRAPVPTFIMVATTKMKENGRRSK